mgnify:CR=1 FL=1
MELETLELQDALERVLRSYGAYYTIDRTNPTVPFAAQAVFHAHGEQYFLIKQAKYAEIDSNEYVYFALEHAPTPARIRELSKLAWEAGLAQVVPTSTHRESDVLLILLADSLSDETAREIRGTRYSKSYRLGLQGYSHFRLAAIEPATGRTAHNPMGQDLAKLLSNIYQ